VAFWLSQLGNGLYDDLLNAFDSVGGLDETSVRNILRAYTLLFTQDSKERAGVFALAQYLASLYHRGKKRRYRRVVTHCLRPSTSKIVGRYTIMSASRGMDFRIEAMEGFITADRFECLLKGRWGKNFRDPDRLITELRSLPPLRTIGASITGWIRENSRSPIADETEWHQRQFFATSIAPYIADLFKLEELCRGEGRVEDAKEINTALLSLIDQDGLQALYRLQNTDARVLFCGAHAGAPLYLTELSIREGLGREPLALVAGETTATRVSASDTITAFYSVVKHLRIPSQYAMINGDGRSGETPHEIDLFGVPIGLANGAPHAVFYSKCQIAFYVAKWKANKIFLDLSFDTQLRPGEKIDEWTHRWIARYKDVLIDVVTGEPEDLKTRGGFWTPIAAHLKGADRDD
jgi:hypothetical protein